MSPDDRFQFRSTAEALALAEHIADRVLRTGRAERSDLLRLELVPDVAMAERHANGEGDGEVEPFKLCRPDGRTVFAFPYGEAEQ